MPEMEEGEAKSRAKAEPKNSSKMLGSVKRPGRSRKMRKLETHGERVLELIILEQIDESLI